jgi:hypothetical protein
MAYAYFISERYLKDNSPMGDNVDIKDIYPYAKSAEDIYIQEAIGTPLFERLIAGLTASPQNITPNETVLLKLIRSAIVYWTCYDALPFMWMKLRNIGLVKQSGDNLETVSEQEMAYIRKELKNKADFYMKRLQDYLCENSTLFSEYGGNYSWSDLYPNPDTSSSCDIAFPKEPNKYDKIKRFIPR